MNRVLVYIGGGDSTPDGQHRGISRLQTAYLLAVCASRISQIDTKPGVRVFHSELEKDSDSARMALESLSLWKPKLVTLPVLWGNGHETERREHLRAMLGNLFSLPDHRTVCALAFGRLNCGQITKWVEELKAPIHFTTRNFGVSPINAALAFMLNFHTQEAIVLHPPYLAL